VRYPHFDFYPGDWVHDAHNRYQSLAAKGAHIELLCLMWNEATETQFGLIDDDRGLARALGIPVEEWKTLRADLIDGPYAVLQVEDGRIISRRLREEWRKAVRRCRPRWRRLLPDPDSPSLLRREYRRLRKHLVARVFGRDGYRCRACGRTDRLSIDHIVPIARGGSNDIRNLQTLCLPCNLRKGAH
jgi:hypothetical protein